jgi:hypothetical protein
VINALNGGKIRRSDPAMTRDNREIEARLSALREEHRDLDTAIDALGSAGSTDQLQMARLKKRKLRLKDEIKMLEDQLIPDIIA